jgi:hypothetical protein
VPTRLTLMSHGPEIPARSAAGGGILGVTLAAIVCKATGPVLLALVGGFSVAASLGIGLVALGVIGGGTGLAALIRRRRGDAPPGDDLRRHGEKSSHAG